MACPCAGPPTLNGAPHTQAPCGGVYFLLILVRICCAVTRLPARTNTRAQRSSGMYRQEQRVWSQLTSPRTRILLLSTRHGKFLRRPYPHLPLWLATGWPILPATLGSSENLATTYRPRSRLYWTLRVLMLTLSVVMEDWAVHELVESPRARRVAVTLVASSYVTWTFQTHTFSNSLETLLVS